MTSKLILGVAAAALALAGLAAPADAQSRRAAQGGGGASATAGAAITGPALPGVCIYSDDRAIGASNVGKAAAARMQQLRSQVSAELSGEQTVLQNDAKTFQAQRSTLSQTQLQSQGQALQAREQALEAKASQRTRELEATGGKALQSIHTQLVPIVSGLSAARNCSVLLSGDAVIAANPAMDLTPGAIQQLNARMSTISFDRETLPAGR